MSEDQFDVDASIEFNADQTVNIAFRNVALADVHYIFTDQFGLDFVAGLQNAVLARNSG